MEKKYTIKVKTGSFQAADGTTKNRYLEIGSIIEGDRGPFMLLSRTFSPSGIDVEPGKDMIVCSMFEPKDFQDDIPAAPGKKTQGGYQDQNIPF